MKFLRTASWAIGLALLGGAFLPTAKADDYDKKTTVTFSAPVEIPAVHLQGWGVLPPGTYVFKLLNSSSNRHIVQIFNKEQTKIYATILAIPNYRLTATNKTVMNFNEGIRGKPESIRAWFYPGANWGEEFVYPKSKAVALAKDTNLPVLAVVATFPEESATPDAPEVIAQLEKVPLIAVRPTGEEVEIAQVVQTAPRAATATPAQQPAATAQSFQVPADDVRLPDTGSSVPLIALVGLLSLGGAFSLLAVRKRVGASETR
ncbi:MAG: LPXTG cell wall anchor domain-containing protein [Bryobacteraceae bacterium]